MKNVLLRMNIALMVMASVAMALVAYAFFHVKAFVEKGLTDSRKIRVLGETSVCAYTDKDEPRFNGCNTIL